MRSDATWRVATRIAVVMAVGAWGAVTACSGSSGGVPAGSGNDVINDTRDASVRAPANPDPGDDDAGDAMSGPVYSQEGGGSTFPGIAECGNCTCSADTHYCFGGATARQIKIFQEAKPLAAVDAGKDAGGLPACVVVPAGAPTLGCNDSPAGCTDCACVLSALQPSFSCYLVCAGDGNGAPMTVYCPNP